MGVIFRCSACYKELKENEKCPRCFKSGMGFLRLLEALFM